MSFELNLSRDRVADAQGEGLIGESGELVVIDEIHTPDSSR